MSTKINVRSPYYIDVQEPTAPSVELTCALIALQGFAVDEFGNISLPNPAYGDILSYSSTDSDFADGKFDTVSTDTSRTVTFRISIPPNFTNSASDYIECDATTTQPEFVCTGGVTTSGSIPNQSLDADGNTVEIDLSSYFVAGTDPIVAYRITNAHPDFFGAYVDDGSIYITSGSIAGTETLFVEAVDGDATTCNATQSIQVTVTTTATFDCAFANVQGGIVNQDGSIINPIGNFDTITAIRTTPTGSPITSLPANNTGSFISHTLYFDITVPTGYTNTGATVQCSKDYDQVSSSLPEFNCEVASLTGQGIYTSGAVFDANVAEGTISGFSPISFDPVTTTTPRSVTFSITPPASGYSNSGGSDIDCSVTLLQPPVADIPCASGSGAEWYMNDNQLPYLTQSQNPSSLNYQDSYEGELLYGTGRFEKPYTRVLIGGTKPSQWIGNTICYYATGILNQRRFIPAQNVYIRVDRKYGGGLFGYPQFFYYTTSGIITEYWQYNTTTKKFVRVTTP